MRLNPGLFRPLVSVGRRRAAVGVLCVAVCATSSETPPYIPYADLAHLSPAEIATVQIKLTYMGPQFGPLASTILYVAGGSPDPSLFAPFRRPSPPYLNYANDRLTAIGYSAISTAEFVSLVSRIGELPEVTDGDVARVPWLGLSILVGLPPVRAFDSVLNRQEAATLYERLRTALTANASASKLLSDRAGQQGVSEAANRREVTGFTIVEIDEPRRGGTSTRYFATATIRNTSNDSLPSPLSLVVLGLPPNSYVFTGDPTCGSEPDCRQYVRIPVPSAGLAPQRLVHIPSVRPAAPS